MSMQEQSEIEFETPDGVSELYRGGTVVGIPSDHFGGALLFSSLFAASLSWVVGLAFGFGLMSMLYFIHQDDKQALDIWKDRLRSRWGAWRIRRGVTKVIFLDE